MKMRDGIRLGPITSSQSLKPLLSGFSSSHSFVQFSQVYRSFPPTARVLSALTAFLLSLSLWPWLMHSLDRSPLTPLTPRIDSTLILSAPPLYLHYPCCCMLIGWWLLGYLIIMVSSPSVISDLGETNQHGLSHWALVLSHWVNHNALKKASEDTKIPLKKVNKELPFRLIWSKVDSSLLSLCLPPVYSLWLLACLYHACYMCLICLFLLLISVLCLTLRLFVVTVPMFGCS